MNSRQLKKIRIALQQLRKNFTPIKASELERYASAVGRQKDDRGKEPTWVRKIDPQLSPPLSIPNHSRDMKAGTARSIIDQLLADVDEWAQHLQSLEGEEDQNEDDECDPPLLES